MSKFQFNFGNREENNEQKVYTGTPQRPQFKLPKIGKKFVLSMIALALIVFLAMNSVFIVYEGQYAFVTQFGKIVRIVEEPGLKFAIPFIQDHYKVDSRLLFYDVSPSEVLTADKKAMIVDSYALWRISDVRLFIRTVATQHEFERRLDAACYSVIKNVMGQLQQTELISDEESSRASLNNRVSEMVKKNMENYGVEVKRVEIRRYDLPQDNLAAVYDRMISERTQIAAQFEAEGKYEAAKIRNLSDKEAQVIEAEAEAESERIRGEAEAKYIEILAEAYNTEDKAEFYNLLIEISNLKDSLSNSPIIILDENSEVGSKLTKDKNVGE